MSLCLTRTCMVEVKGEIKENKNALKVKVNSLVKGDLL